MKNIIWAIAVALWFGAVFSGCAENHRDNSDPPGGNSGFIVFTDHLTGCQYIGWRQKLESGGTLTPRMNKEGKQVCE